MQAIKANKRLVHVKLAAIFGLLNIVDAALTWVVAADGGYELNPVTRTVIAAESVWGYWGYQAGTTLVCIALLLFLARFYPRQLGKVFIGLIIAMAAVCLFNLSGLLGLY